MRQRKKIIAAFAGLLLATSSVQAQSLNEIFSQENLNKVVNAVTGKSAKVDMCGTWDYSGMACEFESENLLKRAGGAIAATAVEKEMNEQCAKIGIVPGKFSFTFNADSTFINTYGKKQYKGTYSYNAATQSVQLKYLSIIGFSAKTAVNTKDMTLLFNADKLLKLFTFFGSKSNSNMVKLASSLAQKYDGMLLGFKLKRK